MDKVSKSTYIIAAAAFVIIVAAIYFLFIFQKKPSVQTQSSTSAEVKDAKEVPAANLPFVTLTPTSNGVEIIMKMTNMSYFDKIEYELTYQADNPQIPGQKIERGSTGTDINSKAPLYEYQILLGTASKGVRSPDTGITDGKLTLHMFKGETEYRSDTTWNLMQIGNSNPLASADGKFKFTSPLATNYWMIAADTVGIPPQDNNQNKIDAKNVFLPVYGAFSITPALTKPAKVAITLDQSVQNPTLYIYNAQDKSWTKVDSTFDSQSKTLSAQVNAFGAFVVTSSK